MPGGRLQPVCDSQVHDQVPHYHRRLFQGFPQTRFETQQGHGHQGVALPVFAGIYRLKPTLKTVHYCHYEGKGYRYQ